MLSRDSQHDSVRFNGTTGLGVAGIKDLSVSHHWIQRTAHTKRCTLLIRKRSVINSTDLDGNTKWLLGFGPPTSSGSMVLSREDATMTRLSFRKMVSEVPLLNQNVLNVMGVTTGIGN